MRELIDSWFTYISNANAVAGVPLIVIGLALMFMGWQFHRFAVPFTYLLVGLALGRAVFEDPGIALMAGAGCGLVLGLIGFFAMRSGVAVLGGLAGIFVVMGYLSLFERLVIPDTAEIAIAVFSFCAACSMSYIMHREMTIVITALVGSFLLVSGMDPVLKSVLPRLYYTITAFLEDYPGFLVPFVLGGPTLIASLIQMANANRGDTGQA